MFEAFMINSWSCTWIVIYLLIGFFMVYRGIFGPLLAGYLVILIQGLTGMEFLSILLAAVSFVLVKDDIRANFITKPIMGILQKMGVLPAISQTEREAIDAGTVWVEKEFFTGKPDFDRIMAQSYPKLVKEEREFLDNQCDTVCDMVNDWEAWCDGDLTPEAWDYIKKERFFSMIISKKYGGLEFTSLANSYVCGKLNAHAQALGITVMVPNSLGPAELLAHYGTEEQKEYYLPRLADGREVPCFALTEPTAGSDAGAITANGVVFKHENGELYMRLNFEKRYITLAAVSTVLGLAFKLDDPENLLGKGEHLGVTCALLPSDTPGITLGRRHAPMGSPFYNCPINGKDIEVPIAKHVVGGLDGVGRGWRMLMDCLSAGRAITLPATSTGMIKLCARATGAYAKVRKQFGISIGKFEGIEELLAEIGGYNYLMEAVRIYTCGGVDRGEKPSVVSAICKYHFTEIGREVINHSMDIAGGSAISKGPRNIFANAYISMPIAITVEGANVLTRTMIIFGQGLIRCHPHVQDEVNAIENNDYKAFDQALWKHITFVVRNVFRAVGLSLTRGWLAPSHSACGSFSKYARKINWASSVFSVLADMSMGVYGGNLKRKERMTGRLGDMLSWLYMATCVMKRFETEGRKSEHKVMAVWSLERCMQKYQEALEGVLQNFDIPVLGWVLKYPIRAFFRFNSFGAGPSDRIGQKIAKILQTPGALRDEMTDGLYISKDNSKHMGLLEEAFLLDCESEAIVKKLTEAIRSKRIKKGRPHQILGPAVEAGVISQEEAEQLKKAYEKCIEAIQVDSFDIDDYKNNRKPTAL